MSDDQSCGWLYEECRVFAGEVADGENGDEMVLECFLRRGRVSGLNVNVRFAGPLFAHSAQSEEISGWLPCERRILGRGGVSVDEVMLAAGKRYSRVGGRPDDQPSDGKCVRDWVRRRELEVEAV